jgi:hypothetical protein
VIQCHLWSCQQGLYRWGCTIQCILKGASSVKNSSYLFCLQQIQSNVSLISDHRKCKMTQEISQIFQEFEGVVWCMYVQLISMPIELLKFQMWRTLIAIQLKKVTLNELPKFLPKNYEVNWTTLKRNLFAWT